MKAQKNTTLTIQDISTLKGVYQDTLVLDNKLLKMVQVEGINLDLLDAYGKSQVFEGYGSFLLYLTANRERIQNVSITSKIDMIRYNLYWKRKYLETQEDTTLPADKKENLLQLIASRCLWVESIGSKSEISTKKHIMVLTVPIKNYSRQELADANEELNEKTKRIIENFRDGLLDAALSVEAIPVSEMLDVLYLFTDNKTAVRI